MLAIADGMIRGFCIGQNPAVGGHNAGSSARAWPNLDWMVVRDAFETETASFWYASPEVKRGRARPAADQDRGLLPPGRAAAARRRAPTRTPSG